jgi:hypothetical protein
MAESQLDLWYKKLIDKYQVGHFIDQLDDDGHSSQVRLIDVPSCSTVSGTSNKGGDK